MATEKKVPPQITDSSTSSTHAPVDKSVPVLLMSATRLLPSIDSRHTLACIPIRQHPDHATLRPVPQAVAIE
jgi:hypothetical protein